jgi:hypothetical protein
VARALYAQGRFGDAESWARRCVEACDDGVQEELDATWLLVRILEAQGRLFEALEVFKHVYESTERELGVGHADAIEYLCDYIRL